MMFDYASTCVNGSSSYPINETFVAVMWYPPPTPTPQVSMSTIIMCFKFRVVEPPREHPVSLADFHVLVTSQLPCTAQDNDSIASATGSWKRIYPFSSSLS